MSYLCHIKNVFFFLASIYCIFYINISLQFCKLDILIILFYLINNTILGQLQSHTLDLCKYGSKRVLLFPFAPYKFACSKLTVISKDILKSCPIRFFQVSYVLFPSSLKMYYLYYLLFTAQDRKKI